MFSTQTVEPLWPNTANKPSMNVWCRWKRKFFDYIELLLTLNPSIHLSEDQQIKLLRQHLGSEGIYENNSLDDALKALDGLWSLRVHVHTARFALHKLHQQPEETVDDFILRIQRTLPDCRYHELPPSKFEEVMATQCLLARVWDDKARERLL
ncbi:unnamed protein product [Echinostoma caproni]|uniref:Retrotransposon gag domain-containing protein n=1 Tax=Echinostoma caproni TaxID=27848 RepID=A0A183A097_9TREM|nr:unnamed protein product [Echinostoma caproni]